MSTKSKTDTGSTSLSAAATLMPEDFAELRNGVSSALVDTTRTAGELSNEDLSFLRSSNPSIAPMLEQGSARLLQLARRLTKIATSGIEVSTPRIEDVDSLEENWKGIVDVFDNLLEKADACLDEYTGAVRRLSPAQQEQIKKAATPARKQRSHKAYRTQDIAKPQLLFHEVPKNDEVTPFKPLLRSKPHALVPLEESLVLVPSPDGSQQYGHPYEAEIKASRYPCTAYAKADPIPYTPYETTVATMVDTPEAILPLLEELKVAKEIAVDLEHHDEHSYTGLVSLMQISTRDKDWIVDTLRPWRLELQALNAVFADPTILKVFHGASMDMVWLQRDFGLYIVGLFDTYHASRALGYSKNGLGFLLKHFVDFDAAKQYQTADWRIRPLPEEMFNYARSDTHFLLYIYDNLRNELIDKSIKTGSDNDLIGAVMNKSKGEALQRYERPLYDSDRGLGAMGWYPLLCRTPALFNCEQFAVFKAVHRWRDNVARQEDESLHSVMPKHVLYKIARETPTEVSSLYGCSHPMSETLLRRKNDLLRVVQQAKRRGAKGPEMKESMQAAQPLYVERNLSVASNGRTMSPHYAENQDTLKAKQPSFSGSVSKSGRSVFWGSAVVGANTSQALQVDYRSEGIRLALPLPQLRTQVFEDQKFTYIAKSPISQTNPSTHVEHQCERVKGPREEDHAFVVKKAEKSRKRKASQTRDGSEPISSTFNGHAVDSIARGVDESLLLLSDRLFEQDEKKHRKRAKKEARRLEKAGAVIGDDGPGDEDAFDYANAPSVLHTKRSANGVDTGKFANPYSKSMNAPKGMRKTKTELDGKSFTFKRGKDS